MQKDSQKPRFPGIKVTTNGNQLVASTEAMICEAGVFYPITPSTEQGEIFQATYAKGQLNAFGDSLIAIETEGEHAAQGGAIAISITGKRTVNFTSGQGIVYGMEQYYHAPGKLSTMVLSVGARALTKHALNVHCGHDDIYSALDTGWLMTFAKDAQQAADQAIILRKVTELALNPGINVQDGFLTTHLERTFLKPEPALIREFLGRSSDMIDCPTEAQKALFGSKRRRVPAVIDLKDPVLVGPVQNQEHYMNGVAARRNNFSEPILGFFEQAYKEFAELTGRNYGLISQYRCEDATTVFIALGSAAENIEAAVDHLRSKYDAKVGVIHVNVIRPFPENAIINALKGKKQVIILERTDESLSTDNPLTRDIRTTLAKACNNFRTHAYPHLNALNSDTEIPEIFSGVYGLGSRDFRPEGIIGAYEFATGKTARKDGKKASDGIRFFNVGIEHPYAVISTDAPSLLPKGSIAVRFHSIGGWGMITTGKNLGEILGSISDSIAIKKNLYDEHGKPQELIKISANPKYGSEKKGAPTNYFLVAAPERIRVNCDLRHVNVVLCCDPKIFTHTNPLVGLEEGGAFVWETSEPDALSVWQRIPKKFRKVIIDKKIKIYALNGFGIAKQATDRKDLQTRMQGNAFLGAFFKVSPLLSDYGISSEEFLKMVKEQYNKKFGRFGESVVESNMRVMKSGFDQLRLIEHGDLDAKDTSLFTSDLILPACSFTKNEEGYDPSMESHLPMYKMSNFDSEFRAGLGYDQPASPLASVGIVASGTGKTASKYVSRVETPIYHPENCTQCMECITVCPDTALPNTAQDIKVVLVTAVKGYVTDEAAREKLLSLIDIIEPRIRREMNDSIELKRNLSFTQIVTGILVEYSPGFPDEALNQLVSVLNILPLSYQKAKGIWQIPEKKTPGAGGLFSIFISDLCKGCGACVDACGDHNALSMTKETEEIHSKHLSALKFLDRLPDTDQKYLGLYNATNPEETKAAALRNHLMQRSKYEALVAGDGACAGCGEKSVLRSVSTLTEAYMRPIFFRKADRLLDKVNKLRETGLANLHALKSESEESYKLLRRTILHTIMGFGGSDTKETESRINAEFKGSDKDLIEALIVVMRQDAYNHRSLRTIEGSDANGMCVMAMAAHTGCNSVYGSTPPNNPHPYPWMNSLFQDGATIGWLIGESFIKDHATRSVIPERIADLILDKKAKGFNEDAYFNYVHFTDSMMSDLEISELPKVWAIGGDGGMGDIGFQNVSKVVLQNRPNINMMMLNTQVYSNTGGQNSEQSVMTGGFDMNQAGPATEGKLSEMKSIAEAFLGGHGSPFIAQVSMANSATLYKAIMDGMCYRGASYIQAYTPCQPEHGIPDYASPAQSKLARDSRGMPEFVFNPSEGESYEEAMNIKGNPNTQLDWYKVSIPGTQEKYNFTVAHWAFTEARFRLHHKEITEVEASTLISLDDKLKLVTMNDIIHRRHLDPTHRAYIPTDGVYTIEYKTDRTKVYHKLSRQMVIFNVERRKAWRMMQSRAGIVNKDYLKQKALLKKIDSGEWTVDQALKADFDSIEA